MQKRLCLRHEKAETEGAWVGCQGSSDEFFYLVLMSIGKFRMLGNETCATDGKPKQDSGEGVSGEFGTTLEITVTDTCPAPFYAGKIQLDATNYIDAATGEKKNQ